MSDKKPTAVDVLDYLLTVIGLSAEGREALRDIGILRMTHFIVVDATELEQKLNEDTTIGMGETKMIVALIGWYQDWRHEAAGTKESVMDAFNEEIWEEYLDNLDTKTG